MIKQDDKKNQIKNIRCKKTDDKKFLGGVKNIKYFYYFYRKSNFIILFIIYKIIIMINQYKKK